jgi:hypothetical protein
MSGGIVVAFGKGLLAQKVHENAGREIFVFGRGALGR